MKKVTCMKIKNINKANHQCAEKRQQRKSWIKAKKSIKINLRNAADSNNRRTKIMDNSIMCNYNCVAGMCVFYNFQFESLLSRCVWTLFNNQTPSDPIECHLKRIIQLFYFGGRFSHHSYQNSTIVYIQEIDTHFMYVNKWNFDLVFLMIEMSMREFNTYHHVRYNTSDNSNFTIQSNVENPFKIERSF